MLQPYQWADHSQVKHHQRVHQPSNLERYVREFIYTTVAVGLWIFTCQRGCDGLVLVEPKEGLPKVDREFYIMQSEFYTKGEFGEPGLQPFSMQKPLMNALNTSLFNGKVGATMDGNALKAKPVKAFVYL